MVKNIILAYLEKQKFRCMGTLYEPSWLRKVRMHILKVVRDLEMYVFVQDGQHNNKNEKIVNFVNKNQRVHIKSQWHLRFSAFSSKQNFLIDLN